ncbi:MAG: (d)CMP kinase [Acidobacteriota bacterium]
MNAPSSSNSPVAGAQEPKALVVAIDGPAGVGKSTVARLLARRLGVPYLDTGAMYRAMGLKLLRAGEDPAARSAAARFAAETEISLRPDPHGNLRVLLDGEEVESQLRSPEVSSAASSVATHPEVRHRMVELQRAAGEVTGGVLEGRDIGTRVFPQTPHKFFLEAQMETRVARRFEQMKAKDPSLDLQALQQEMEERDHRDRNRSEAPLTYDETYHLVDTTELTIDQVVEAMAAQVEERLSS